LFQLGVVHRRQGALSRSTQLHRLLATLHCWHHNALLALRTKAGPVGQRRLEPWLRQAPWRRLLKTSRSIQNSQINKEAAWLALVLLLTYVGVSYGVHHAYPFYVADMYSYPPPLGTGRMGVLRADGRLQDVTDFAAFDCPEPLREHEEACLDCDAVAGRVEDAWRWLQAHRQTLPPDAETAQLVWHVWHFERDAQHRQRNYLIHKCRIVPLAGRP